jgi:RNA 2',3'-cyclic 3'-phosphodiesterase
MTDVFCEDGQAACRERLRGGLYMRLFIALPLGFRVREKVQALIAPFRSRTEEARWTQPQSWHITLQFLGKSTTEQLACLRNALKGVGSPAFPFALGEMGTFGAAGVLFLEVRMSRDLAMLQQRIVEATSSCGFVQDSRPYHPHITLARGKKNAPLRHVNALEGCRGIRPGQLSGVAQEFCLYESLAGPEGSRYEVVASFPLLASQI